MSRMAPHRGTSHRRFLAPNGDSIKKTPTCGNIFAAMIADTVSDAAAMLESREHVFFAAGFGTSLSKLVIIPSVPSEPMNTSSSNNRYSFTHSPETEILSVAKTIPTLIIAVIRISTRADHGILGHVPPMGRVFISRTWRIKEAPHRGFGYFLGNALTPQI